MLWQWMRKVDSAAALNQPDFTKDTLLGPVATLFLSTAILYTGYTGADYFWSGLHHLITGTKILFNIWTIDEFCNFGFTAFFLQKGLWRIWFNLAFNIWNWNWNCWT
jgi:hypothetical protein